MFVFYLEDFLMPAKPTYEELEQRVKKFEKAESERKKAEEALRESEERLRSRLTAFSNTAAVVL